MRSIHRVYCSYGSTVPPLASGLQESAIGALEAIEEPLAVLYTPALRATQRALPVLSAPPTSILPAPTISALPEPSQSGSVHSARTRANRTSRPSLRRLLFLRNHATTPPQIVKLICPDCGKTDFSSLQGLLNHCRLRHQREFGSHDECVQCCAVLVEREEDQAWLVANGTEVAGISLPGLRRLFEIAVGGGQGLGTILPPMQIERKVVEQQTALSPQVPEPVLAPAAGTSTHVTRTLGHHADTPALAPFLGRETTRRYIRIFDEDENVDVFGYDDASQGLAWKMHYTHRSKARASLDEAIAPSTSLPPLEDVSPRDSTATGIHASHATAIQPSLGSRFHIIARVSVQDLSLWISPGLCFQAATF